MIWGPLHLSHGRKGSGRTRSLKCEIIKGLLIQGIAKTEDEVCAVDEIAFDFAPAELADVSGSKSALTRMPRAAFASLDDRRAGRASLSTFTADTAVPGSVSSEADSPAILPTAVSDFALE